MIKRIELKREDVVGNISDFYDIIATKFLGKRKDVQYDCFKIRVSMDIFDAMQQKYLEINSDSGYTQDSIKESFAMNWCIYGPKCDINEPGFIVEICDGFVLEEQNE